VITRLGRDTADRGDLRVVRAPQRLDINLHPELERKARRQYLMGEYDLAAFAALRMVEVRVRGLLGASVSDRGVPLMRKAFAKEGPYWDEGRDGGDQVARMELFAGRHWIPQESDEPSRGAV
jgi:hypothetical protein